MNARGLEITDSGSPEDRGASSGDKARGFRLGFSETLKVPSTNFSE